MSLFGPAIVYSMPMLLEHEAPLEAATGKKIFVEKKKRKKIVCVCFLLPGRRQSRV